MASTLLSKDNHIALKLLASPKDKSSGYMWIISEDAKGFKHVNNVEYISGY